MLSCGTGPACQQHGPQKSGAVLPLTRIQVILQAITSAAPLPVMWHGSDVEAAVESHRAQHILVPRVFLLAWDYSKKAEVVSECLSTLEHKEMVSIVRSGYCTVDNIPNDASIL